MRIEPTRREADPVALAAVICGVAPVPLAFFGILPFIGLLTGPLMVFSIFAAIVCGVIGIARAKQQPEPNYVLPATGIVLGLLWLALSAAVIVYFTRH